MGSKYIVSHLGQCHHQSTRPGPRVQKVVASILVDLHVGHAHSDFLSQTTPPLHFLEDGGDGAWDETSVREPSAVTLYGVCLARRRLAVGKYGAIIAAVKSYVWNNRSG